MINFVVVEDNEIHRKKITKSIMSKMMNNRIDFKIHEFDDYNNDLINYINKDKGESIYILDIELKSGDGTDVARYIRNTSNNWISPIIIITAHSSLYYEIYKQRLQILDFISKCSGIDEQISENIDICLRMLNQEKTYRFTFKNVDYAINFTSIDYIQRDGRRTKIVTKKETLYQNLSISQISKLLPKYFVISTKGTLVNIKNIDKIDWKTNIIYFKDGLYSYIASANHRKELETSEYR